MYKLKSLIKASMFDNMTLFKLKSQKKMKLSEKLLPVALIIICFLLNGIIAQIIIEPLHKENMDIVLLTLFILYTSLMTLIEGVYKSGSLMFNCKDDNLLLSLPIKKSTVLLVRILKFYAFEMLYNSVFLIPAIIIYAIYNNVGLAYYLVSFVALLLLPIVPVLLSCIIGGAISAYSSRFKLKSFAEIVVTTLSLLAIFYVSLNLNTALGSIVTKASNINTMVINLYYPAGGYIRLVENFNLLYFLLYIIINMGISLLIVGAFSKIYFKINSKIKIIKTKSRKKDYKIITRRPINSLIKKEFNRFIYSPVYVTNSGFGLVLFIIACIMISINYSSIDELLAMKDINIPIDQIKTYMPVILFGLICFTALMTSITSSMISLEGRAFNILKSFPIKPIKIIISKILTAMIIMMPFIVIGDIIVIITFKFDLFETFIILLTSIVLPFIAETIGILVNLKYPRLDAENDTQVVKQSISSMISVFIGMILSAITIFVLVQCAINGISPIIILSSGITVYTIIGLGLLYYLVSTYGLKKRKLI